MSKCSVRIVSKLKLRYWTLFWPKYCAANDPTGTVVSTAAPIASSPTLGRMRSPFRRIRIARGNDRRVAPQPLELVELPQLGMENVYHEVHIIEQNPTPLRQPFHVMRLDPRRRERLDHVLRHAAHVRVRRPRDDHEIIRRTTQAAQIQYYRIDGLPVHQRIDDLGELSLHSDRTRPTHRSPHARQSRV